MKYVECTTQAELDAIDKDDVAVLVGAGLFEFWGSSAPKLVCREFSAPNIVCWGSSAPNLECRGFSAPNIVCWGSSAPNLECRGFSAPNLECRGFSAPNIVCWGSSAPNLECRGFSAPNLECWEFSAPNIVCWGSSAPNLECRGFSAPNLECWEFSAPNLECWGYVQTRIVGCGGKVKATKNCHTLIRGEVEVVGGKQTRIAIGDVRAWCDYYGVRVVGGLALVYKAVDDAYTTDRGVDYSPGKKPIAADWDGGEKECGGGLHFSPSPGMAKQFNACATKFVGCWVRVSEMRKPKDGDSYPGKCKAKRVVKPCFEVDEDGRQL